MNGIPPGIASSSSAAAAAAAVPSSNTTTTGASSGGPLEALRQHPQFTDLKRLVQTNPNMLSAVLQQIGQQQPELLQAINMNQAEFLQMMNEPVVSSSSEGGGGGGAVSSSSNTNNNNNPGGSGTMGMPPDMEALGNPAQLAAMLQSMPIQEQHAMASMMGMTVEQLQQTAQMISAMPPEQVQQYMNMAMQGAAGGGLGGMMGMGGSGGGGGGAAGAQVLRLSEEEMAAVNRLTEMGFDRAAAAQAYLACDKNEALAANLLMDGGFADFGDDDDGDMGGGGMDGDDDMYD
jgi:UV excision repair protein RAD23